MDALSVLIIAPPGRLRDSLRVLLRASPHVAHVAQADDLPAGVQRIAELSPTLVLLDADVSGNGVTQAVQQIKAHRLTPPCIVLAHTTEQESQARVAGAAGIFMAGAAAEAFFAALASVFQEGTGDCVAK
jgi:DNA-binding NarL/FixJ family response regulator